MLGYLSLEIICPSKLTVFLELRSFRFLEHIMSADKNPCIFSRQMADFVYVLAEKCKSCSNKGRSYCRERTIKRTGEMFS